MRIVMETIPSLLPPPPPSRWNENRAKFSDVVARSQEIVTPYSSSNHVNHKGGSNLSAIFSADVRDAQYAKPQPAPELPAQTPKEYSSIAKPGVLSEDKDKTHDMKNLLILQPDSQHSNSYFVNTFAEHPVSSISSLSRRYLKLFVKMLKMLTFALLLAVRARAGAVRRSSRDRREEFSGAGDTRGGYAVPIVGGY